MMQAQWRLRDFLEVNGITPYKLAKAIPGVRQATIYRLAAEEAPQSVSFDVLSQVLLGLKRVTGRDVTPNDLIALVEEKSADDHQWLSADLSRASDLEPYDWGTHDPLQIGEPVSLNSDGRFIAGAKK